MQRGPRGSWEKLPILLLILRSIYKIRNCVEQMNMRWKLPIKVGFFCCCCCFFFGQIALFNLSVSQRLVAFAYGAFMEKVLKIVPVCC